MDISINKILKSIDYIEFINNIHCDIINKFSELENMEENTISWCNNKNLHKIKKIFNKIIIIPELDIENKDVINNKENNYIICKNPRLTFLKILNIIYPDKVNESPIIGNNVYIGDNVEIGNNVKISHNTVIHDNTKIGDNVTIGCNNTIGGIGFGYEKNEKGEFESIKHIGNVIIGDNVEIGNNTCIDRGVLGSTYIGNNTKIDNLVHISHGVKIGENSLIIANSMIAGSVTIGNNTWISPSTSIINGNKIGNNSMTGMGAVVISDIKDNELHIGFPSKKYKNI